MGSLSSLGLSPAAALSLGAGVGSLAFGSLALAGGLLSPHGIVDALGLTRGKLRGGGLVAAALGLLGLSFALDAAIRAGGLREASVLHDVDVALAGARGGEVALAILGIAFGPGICEELLLRGLVLRGLARRMGPALAVLISSLAFGVLHLDAVQGGAALLLGIYLGVVALADGSTRAPIVCHVVNNLVTTVVVIAGGAHEPVGQAALDPGVAASLW